MKTSLFVSVSFGRSSGFMARQIQRHWDSRFDNIYYLFANTGFEHEETLKFGRKMQDEWAIPIIWLEAVIDPRKGYGIRHKVVTFETASRNGEPFEAHCAKEGIPGPANKKCSDRLKVGAMRSYRRSHGYKRHEACTAIGIRVDEVDRINPNYEEEKILYPLISDWPVTSAMVHRWWLNQPFTLDLDSHYGNCVGCFQKSDRKLLTIAQDNPEVFIRMSELESIYGYIKNTTETFKKGHERRFYRNHRTAIDVLNESRQPFTRYVDNPTGIYTRDMFGDVLDKVGDCDNGCVINEGI